MYSNSYLPTVIFQQLYSHKSAVVPEVFNSVKDLPDLIVTVFSNMDTEIAALESRLAKTQATNADWKNAASIIKLSSLAIQEGNCP
ncbi:MAG: hypothetical protein ACRC8A_13210 [Microcoleaceae cyanobacterium]